MSSSFPVAERPRKTFGLASRSAPGSRLAAVAEAAAAAEDGAAATVAAAVAGAGWLFGAEGADTGFGGRTTALRGPGRAAVRSGGDAIATISERKAATHGME